MEWGAAANLSSLVLVRGSQASASEVNEVNKREREKSRLRSCLSLATALSPTEDYGQIHKTLDYLLQLLPPSHTLR